MDKPTYEELVEALESMALQYLTYVDGSLTHNFRNAGEEALPLLERLGIVEPLPDTIGYWQWVEGHKYRAFADSMHQQDAS